jgi:hypothetical protein
MRAEATASGVVVGAGGLEPGFLHYVDADWLPAQGSALVPSIVVAADSRDADDVAGGVLVDLAERAVAALDGAGSATVVGTGTVARQVRRLLAARGVPEPEDAAPDAIVETTGDPTSIAEALRHAASLGTIVLVGEPLGRDASFDLYSDLHVRGLTLVGVARPLPAAPGQTAALAVLPDAVRAELVHAVPGEVLPPGAGWYRLGA